MQIEMNPLQRGPKYCQSLYGAGTTRSLISSMANHQRLLSSRASREKSAGPVLRTRFTQGKRRKTRGWRNSPLRTHVRDRLPETTAPQMKIQNESALEFAQLSRSVRIERGVW